jgi:tetratricopeptide (TPR) repeat protein
MMSMRREALTAVAAALLLLPGPSSATVKNAPRKRPPGVVVEGVAKGSAGEKAGLQPGDVILSWTRAAAPPANPSPASGEVHSLFALRDLEVEQAPRGPVVLTGQRDGQAASWTLSSERWQLSLRPDLPESLVKLHSEAKDLFEAKKVNEAGKRWRAGAADRDSAGLPAVWFLAKAASSFAGARSWAETDAAYSEAIEQASRAGEPAVAARLLGDWAPTFGQRGEWDRAEGCYRQAMERSGAAAAETLVFATYVGNLGLTKLSRGDLDSAADFLQRSLAISEKQAPDSLGVTNVLNNLGNTKKDRGDLDGAEHLYRRSLAIREKIVPESLYVASLNNLGPGGRGEAGGGGHLLRAIARDH